MKALLEGTVDDTPLRVLIVDDETGMRRAVARVLAGQVVALPDAGVLTNPQARLQTSLQVHDVGSGERALEVCEALRPDIVLLDHKLPGISGIDVLDSLRSSHPDTLVVMMTAYASLDIAVAATKRGAVDFLAKPFTPDELRATIYRVARQHTLRVQTRRLAQEKRQVRFQFLSVLAHELKTPLAAVEGYLRLLRDEACLDSEARERSVDRSLHRIDGMRKLITDLLDLTHIESGQRARQLHSVDVVEVARSAVEANYVLAQERRVELRVTASRAVMMVADRSELEIMLNNLVSNAIKYNRPGGAAEVAVEACDAEVCIVVRDTGIGMNPEETSRLFGEFVRIKNDKTRDIEGSGLGLSIVKRLVTLYDGQIHINSIPEVGTEFVLRFKGGQPSAVLPLEARQQTNALLDSETREAAGLVPWVALAKSNHRGIKEESCNHACNS